MVAGIASIYKFLAAQGEAAALQSVVDTIDSCLRAGACRRVPGLPAEQYYFTLILSICGGAVLGFSLRLEPNETISRRWFWPVLFAPLWASLFFSFGLGPVVSRTAELRPIAQNTVAFFAAALIARPPMQFYENKGPSEGQ